MLRSEIPSNIVELNTLHTTYYWVPNETQIRPTEVQQLKKFFLSNTINDEWQSVKDFILHTVFGKTFTTEGNIKLVKDSDNVTEWVFNESHFRYNIDAKANHFVLWNSKFNYSKDFDKEMINQLLTEMIKGKLGHTNFDFAWYKNPKPTVPELFHLQVFWVDLSK